MRLESGSSIAPNAMFMVGAISSTTWDFRIHSWHVAKHFKAVTQGIAKAEIDRMSSAFEHEDLSQALRKNIQ
jgi:hypothetical protein